MKLFSIILLLLPFFSLIGCQLLVGEVPSYVKEAFVKKYPNEKNPHWNLDKNGNFEAKFKQKGVHYRADFTPQGKWIETETNIKKQDLPEAIKKVLKEKYDGFKIAEIEKVDSNKKGLFYDVEFKVNGAKQDVEFNASGQIIN